MQMQFGIAPVWHRRDPVLFLIHGKSRPMNQKTLRRMHPSLSRTPVTHCPYVHTIYYKEIQKKEILIMCCFFNNRFGCGCGCGCRNNNWGCGCNNGCGNNSGCGCNNNNDWRRSRAYRAGFNDGYAVGFRDGFNAASGCGCNNNWRGGVSPLNESEGCGCDN